MGEQELAREVSLYLKAMALYKYIVEVGCILDWHILSQDLSWQLYMVSLVEVEQLLRI